MSMSAMRKPFSANLNYMQYIYSYPRFSFPLHTQEKQIRQRTL